MENKEKLKGKIDWVATLVPLIGVVALCVVFMLLPGQSQVVLGAVRGFLGDDCGIYYALLGVGILLCSLYIAFSKYGKIKLGDTEKPQYSSFSWGMMIFTSTMAADILFYSLCEWALYANEPHIIGTSFVIPSFYIIIECKKRTCKWKYYKKEWK